MGNNNRNTTVIFSLYDDLKFIHGDTRQFTRNEALRAIIIKFQVLKDLSLISDYLQTIIIDQGQQFFLINPEQPAKSIAHLFSDLRELALTLPVYEGDVWQVWRKEINTLLSRFENAAMYCANGKYKRIPRCRTKEGTEKAMQPLIETTKLLQQCIFQLSSKEEPKEENYIGYHEIREALKVSKAETFKQYFDQLEIKIFGSRNKPQITESDFIKLKQFWLTRTA